MRPELCSAVLLPDGDWHNVEPGTMSKSGEQVIFIDRASGEQYSVGIDSVLAARGEKAPPPPPLKRIGQI